MSDWQCPNCGRAVEMPQENCSSCNNPLLLRRRYWLTRRLGQGGYAVVYSALDIKNEMRRCAVKEVPSDSLADEVRILQTHSAQLDFLPEIYDSWQQYTWTYVVMEYIDGETVELGPGERWPPKEVESFLRTMLGNLAQLHAAGIIHRDLNPTNIMRTHDGHYVLLDFGISKQGSVTRTIARKALTLEYAPPEQFRDLSTDPRSDLFSLGVTAYYLLTGGLPPRADRRLGMNQPVELPSARVRGVTAPLERTILRMMELNPDERPPNAASALRMLDDRQTLPPLNGRSAPRGEPPPSSRRQLFLLAVCLLLLAAIIGYLLMTRTMDASLSILFTR